MGHLNNFIEIAIKKSSKYAEKKSKSAPRYNQPIALKSSSKLPVTSQNPWNSALFTDI